MNRDEYLLQIRPTLALAQTSTAQEAFQNNVLRPILKLQNELLLAVIKTHVRQSNKGFNNLKKAEQEDFVKSLITKQAELRSAVIHLVVGMFTIEEYDTYSIEKSENNKRIVQMAIQRVYSQIEQLY